MGLTALLVAVVLLVVGVIRACALPEGDALTVEESPEPIIPAPTWSPLPVDIDFTKVHKTYISEHLTNYAVSHRPWAYRVLTSVSRCPILCCCSGLVEIRSQIEDQMLNKSGARVHFGISRRLPPSHVILGRSGQMHPLSLRG